jgi:lipopolysaccharide transport system permease protein
MTDSSAGQALPTDPLSPLARALEPVRRGWEEVKRYLFVGWAMYIQDLKYRYSMALLGWFWFFIGPILAVVPYIALGKQFDMGAKGSNVRYEVYALVGAMLWQVFWSSVNMPQMMLRRFKRYLKEVNIPPGMILMVCAFGILTNSVVQIAVLIGTVFVSMSVTPSFFLGLLSIPVLMLCGFAIGIFIAPMGIIYRDFRYGMSYMSTLFLMMSPIFYAIPEKGFLRIINLCNPVTYIVGVPRDWCIGVFRWNDVFFVPAVCAFVALLTFGFKFYRRAIAVAMENM